MNHAASQHLSMHTNAQGPWKSLFLAVLVHLSLFAFLWIGISWQNQHPIAVEAEVWDMTTRQAAPLPVPQTEPEPEPAAPTAAEADEMGFVPVAVALEDFDAPAPPHRKVRGHRRPGEGGTTVAVQQNDPQKLAQIAQVWNTTWDLHPGLDAKRFPSSGPYKIASVRADGAVELVANDRWWGAKPVTDRITVWPRGVDVQDRINAGTFNVVDIATGSSGTLTTPDGYTRTDYPSAGIEQLIFAPGGPLAAPPARRAVALCTPRDVIARNPNVSEFRRLCIERGMVTLRGDGLRKVAKGLTTVQEVLRVTKHFPLPKSHFRLSVSRECAGTASRRTPSRQRQRRGWATGPASCRRSRCP